MNPVEIKLNKLSSALTEILDLLEPAVVAGGAARSELTGERVSDFDIFYRDTTALAKASEALTGAGFKITFKCPAGELVSLKKEKAKVQLICKPAFDSAIDLLLQFDFTATQFAITESRDLITTTEALRDVMRKELRLARLTYPVSTLRRANKYIGRGYYASGEFWRALIEEMGQQEWSSEELEMYPID